MMRRHYLRWGTVLLFLSMAVLACTMSMGGGDGSTGGSNNGAVASGDGVPPLVRIVDPPSGATVSRDARVDLTVQTDTTATQFQLVVGGQNASIKLMPPDQAGPTSAILSWTPRREGTFTLEVIAYNNTVPGPPTSILLQVAGAATGGAGTATGGGGVNGCVGRVLVSQLNYRDGPGTNYNRLGQFTVGETVTVTGRNSAGTWYKVVRASAQEAWTIRDDNWLLVEGQCSTLPVVG